MKRLLYMSLIMGLVFSAGLGATDERPTLKEEESKELLLACMREEPHVVKALLDAGAIFNERAIEKGAVDCPECLDLMLKTGKVTEDMLKKAWKKLNLHEQCCRQADLNVMAKEYNKARILLESKMDLKLKELLHEEDTKLLYDEEACQYSWVYQLWQNDVLLLENDSSDCKE